jgi:hypothetical protein
LLLVTIASVVFWLRFSRLKMSASALIALFALFLTCVPMMQGVSILQLGLLVAALIAAACFSIISGRLFIAGALLAFATIKPQLCILPIVWFLIWALSAWRHRRMLLIGFFVTLGALIFTANLLLPGWLMRYPESLRAYGGYTNATSLLGVLFPTALRWVITFATLLITAWHCWRARHLPADSFAFAIALGLVLTLTLLVVPTVVPPFNHVLLLPVALLMILHGKDLWRTNALNRAAA